MGSSQLSATHATSPSLNSIVLGSAEDYSDLSSLESLDHQVKYLLSELTMETFDSISDRIIERVNKRDGKMLGRVVQLIFERAVDDMTSFEMYAQLFSRMMDRMSEEIEDHEDRDGEGKPILDGQLFRAFLLHSCQDLFERIWMRKEVTAVAVALKNTDSKVIGTSTTKNKIGKVRKYSKEHCAAQKANQQKLGFIKITSELFRLQMLPEHIMHEQLKKLLGNVNPEEEDIESLCIVFTRAGSILDTPKAHARMDVYFRRIREFAKNPNVNSRMRSMLQDVDKLHENNWMGNVATLMTHKAEHSRKEKKRIVQKTRGKGGMNDKEEREEQKEEENLKQREKERDEYNCRGGKGKVAEFGTTGKVEHVGEGSKLTGISENGEVNLSPGHDSQSTVAVGVSTRRTLEKHPPPLHLYESSSSPDFHLTTSAIRAIDDLERISYPDGIFGPQHELNVNAKEGRFRYDRDFLMQFMNVCQDKPGKLVPLSAIGLEYLDPPTFGGVSNRRKARR